LCSCGRSKRNETTSATASRVRIASSQIAF
jgi:hypothetical protein